MRFRRLPAVFFSTSARREPFREWLRSLPREVRRLIGEDIAYVQFKWPIGRPRVDHLRGAIWEIRTSVGERIVRTLFAVDDGTMILLHGFIKKTRAVASREIDLAERRFSEYMNGKA